jgi:hypothetical protein
MTSPQNSTKYFTSGTYGNSTQVAEWLKQGTGSPRLVAPMGTFAKKKKGTL